MKKVKKLESTVGEHFCLEKEGKIKHLEEIIQQKDNEINQLKRSCEYLNDVINENINAVKKITVFDEDTQKFLPHFKQCVYVLLQLNVSAAKVSNVVTSVLHMINIEANKLPSKGTILNMNVQRLCLAQKQLCGIFSSKDNATLMTDATSKFGSKFMGYEASDTDGNLWVLGLRDKETKSADTTLKVFKEILNDLDKISDVAESQVSKDIICHITATMSDRAATEVKFNALLEQYRKEILPLTYYNYHTFTDHETISLERMSNFFCGLHALVNFADVALKSLQEVENVIFEGNENLRM